MSFSQLKKSSGNFAQLSEKLKSAAGNSSFERDDRYWSPTVDQAGNGYAVIRFLPAPDGEDVPVVTLFSHGFKGPGGKWYIENSRTTIGESDPVAEANTELWNTGTEANQTIVRQRKRRKHFISNILVLKDPGCPANEGKVFLYKYGAKILGKIELAINPEFPDDPAFDPFDLWKGADFKLKIRKVEGQRNYDSSAFDTPAVCLDLDDSGLEKIWRMEHSLQAEVAPDKFKSYDELKRKFDLVLGRSAGATTPAARADKSESFRSQVDDVDASPSWTEASSTTDEEDDEARFKRLLAD